LIRALEEHAAGAGSLRAVLLVIILVHSAGTFAYMTLWRTIRAPDFDVNDFKAYYTGALALEEGRRDLLYPDATTLNLGVLPDQPWVRFALERGVPHPSGYIYPPFLAVVSRPLTALSYHRANQAWFLMNTLLFAGTLLMLATWRSSGVGPVAAAGILFVSLNYYPTYRAFQCGQVSLLILFLLAAAFWLLERDRQSLSGALVGIAAAVKLTPAILIVFFLVTKRWRAAAGATAAGAAALALSVAGAGWGNHLVFAREMLPALSRGAATFANQSLPGFLARNGMDVTMNAFEFVNEPGWLRILGRISTAAVLVTSLWIARRLALGAAGAPAGFALVVVASLIASPISWEHHYTLALIPIAVLITFMTERGMVPLRELGLLAAGYVLTAANAYDLIRHHFPYRLGRLSISYALYGAILIWILLARSRGTPRVDQQDEVPVGEAPA
jgi:alpha-1,2-mannosyltransferase